MQSLDIQHFINAISRHTTLYKYNILKYNTSDRSRSLKRDFCFYSWMCQNFWSSIGITGFKGPRSPARTGGTKASSQNRRDRGLQLEQAGPRSPARTGGAEVFSQNKRDRGLQLEQAGPRSPARTGRTEDAGISLLLRFITSHKYI